MESDSGSIMQFVLLGVLIIVNAIFAAAEMSIVSANKNKINVMAEEGNKRAVALLKLLEQPNKMLSTIQVVITLAGFLASASASVTLADNVGKALESLGIPYGEELSIVIITLLLSYVTLVLGELFPKRIALAHPEAISLKLVRLVIFMSIITKPFVWLLSKSVEILLKITGQKDELDEDEYSEEEIMTILAMGRNKGKIKKEGTQMIKSVFDFDDKVVYEIMTPRTEVFMIDLLDDKEEYMPELMELRHSRIPVCEKNIDNIIGILHIKDYIKEAAVVGFDNVDIKKILRKPYLVPETKKIDELFKGFQDMDTNLAVIIDEYGGFSGIATVEDIVEEVMGDIFDEYDEADLPIITIDQTHFVALGSISLDDLARETGIVLESENNESLGGFIIDEIDEIPSPKDINRVVKYANFEFRLIDIDHNQIRKVDIRVLPPVSEEE
ncbi:MAG: hemolysin family protein [Anaerovoracaceae bacterium]